jgi:Protein of unknown function (DUF1638)
MTRGRSRAGLLPSPSGRGVGGEGARTGHLPRIRRHPSSGDIARRETGVLPNALSRHLLPEGEGTTADLDSETMRRASSRGARRILVIACGALAREVLALNLGHIDVACLPAQLHNHPKQIPGAMRAKIRANRESYDEILCLYGDCGTGGELDRVLAEERVSRIEGAHCYAFYAGEEAFAALAEEEPGTFYLTDFLARHFDALVIRGLALDRFPELRDDYFGNYRRVVHLAQFEDADLETKAKAAADRLGLAYERRFTGLDGIRRFLDRATQKKDASWPI